MNVVKRKVLANIFKSHPAIVRLLHEETKSIEMMPGPKADPKFGTMLEYKPGGKYDIYNLPATYSKMHKEFGDLVREDCTPNRRIVHVFHPHDMNEVYTSDGEMPRRLSHTVLGKYRLTRPDLYSCQGLIPTNGKEWADFRNTFKRTLIDINYVNSIVSCFEEVTDDLIKVIPDHLDESLETNLTPLLHRWGLETVGYITLNKRLGSLTIDGNPDAEDLIKAAENTHVAVHHTENNIGNYEENYRLLEKSQDLIGSVLGRYVKDFFADKSWPKKNCVLPRLLACDDPKDSVHKKRVFTLLVDMFLAGIDSTALALSYALYNLAKNQSVQEKLREELINFMPTLQDTYAAGLKVGKEKNLKYLRGVLHESLRVNPLSIGNGRLLNKDVKLGGYLVPKDTMVILQHEIASKDERFFKNADKFFPERWYGPKNLASSPFGFGFRTCIGKFIAEKQSVIAIAKFVRNYEISYHHEPIGTRTMLLNFMDKPLRLRLRRITE